MNMRNTTLAIAGALVVTVILLGLLWPRPFCVEEVLAGYRREAAYDAVAIDLPLDETVFPPEMFPPTFRWRDAHARTWLVRIEFDEGEPACFLTRRRQWPPPAQEWERVKHRSAEREARVTILGVGRGRPARVLSRGMMSFRVSHDPVGAPLFYREVVLPFEEADRKPERIRWRFGSILAPKPPPVVMQGLTVCANCHSFSADGSILATDADYANNKGAYLITLVQQQMILTAEDMITWNDYERAGLTFGLLSQISPDGRYVVSTVKDHAVFIAKEPLAFSQLFFPVGGILCVYDRQARTFRALPGADDPNLVQSNPVWSPDGRHIVFARTKAADLSQTRGQGLRPLTKQECYDLVRDGPLFQYDLYRVPFNEGAGGTPEPLEGASHNGMSNYFPRYSPDGRWIVFCRARTYMLLQPDSELYIIPAEGGTARRLRCNTARMNSWHSFSPNGKWLVFASKAWSDYTQLCLTHIDEQGDGSPPILLSHLTAPNRAANIPEFVNAPPDAIRWIREQFVTYR
jgi:hypothetical protein